MPHPDPRTFWPNCLLQPALCLTVYGAPFAEHARMGRELGQAEAQSWDGEGHVQLGVGTATEDIPAHQPVMACILAAPTRRLCGAVEMHQRRPGLTLKSTTSVRPRSRPRTRASASFGCKWRVVARKRRASKRPSSLPRARRIASNNILVTGWKESEQVDNRASWRGRAQRALATNGWMKRAFGLGPRHANDPHHAGPYTV